MKGFRLDERQKVLGPPVSFRFLFGRGMVSDDTEHTIIVAESLIETAGSPALLETALARRLTKWFMLLPAGVVLWQHKEQGFLVIPACAGMTEPQNQGLTKHYSLRLCGRLCSGTKTEEEFPQRR
ncbi:MAG: ADP-ribosylglycohydrolase family protein [Planctomyces sp.]